MIEVGRSSEQAQGEAIRHLTSVLEKAGVEDALAQAHDFVRWLIHEGWRPRGPRCELTEPVQGDRRVPATSDYLAAKAALRGGEPS